MILDEAQVLLDPVTVIDGLLIAALVDTSTGMLLATHQGQSDANVPVAAAAAADMARVLSQLQAELPADGLEDVLITFAEQICVIRLLNPGAAPEILLVVILDRQRANLALARREIRDFCAGIPA